MDQQEKKSLEWTNDEARLLHHEALVNEILSLRADLRQNSAKPWWQRFLESTGGAAVITVLLGGVLGQGIAWQIQKGEKDREFQQAWLKSRGDQALVAYRDYLDGEQELIKRAYELIGNCISASDDLISLTEMGFNPYNPSYNSHEQKVIYDQRTSIYDRFNDTVLKWDNQRYQMGLLMSYYHKSNQDVVNSWHTTEEALARYIDCARKWEHDNPKANLSKEQTDRACVDEKKALKDSLDGFTKSLEAGRRYAWEGWESPENLKSVLDRQK